MFLFFFVLSTLVVNKRYILNDVKMAVNGKSATVDFLDFDDCSELFC